MKMNILSVIELKTILLFLIIGLGSNSCKKADPAADQTLSFFASFFSLLN